MTDERKYPEDSALRDWQHAGLRCVITDSRMAHINGYVQVPEGHPAYAASYDRLNVDVHGGLTYANDRGWFGFDTAHLSDVWTVRDLAKAGVPDPDSADRYRSSYRESNPNYWTVERLVKETEDLADQLASMSELPEPDAWQITDSELAELRAERDRLRARVAELEATR